MSTKILIPLCAAVALLAACGHRDDESGTYSNGPNGTGTAAEPPAATPGVGDTSTTPGGNSGDPTTTPPSTATSPETPPAETPPPNN